MLPPATAPVRAAVASRRRPLSEPALGEPVVRTGRSRQATVGISEDRDAGRAKRRISPPPANNPYMSEGMVERVAPRLVQEAHQREVPGAGRHLPRRRVGCVGDEPAEVRSPRFVGGSLEEQPS